MSTSISVDEAQSNLREIIAQLAPDEEVVITENQQPVAKLVAKRATDHQRLGPGLCKGMLTIVADDEEHLRDFDEYMP
jgi:antitoxin (DNA-binding transcriptional repressor) of toxin-antitoxin stability system